MMNFHEYLNSPMPTPSSDKPKPASGTIIPIRDDDYLPLLPPRLREMVIDMGYVPKFFDHDPAMFSMVMEKCLQNNLEKKSIDAYKSSFLKKETMHGNLMYYAIIHTSTVHRSLMKEAEEVSADIAIVAVYRHHQFTGNSVVVISSQDVQLYDAWIEQLNLAIRHQLTTTGGFHGR